MSLLIPYQTYIPYCSGTWLYMVLDHLFKRRKSWPWITVKLNIEWNMPIILIGTRLITYKRKPVFLISFIWTSICKYISETFLPTIRLYEYTIAINRFIYEFITSLILHETTTHTVWFRHEKIKLQMTTVLPVK